jgi:serine/threonine protein kinase
VAVKVLETDAMDIVAPGDSMESGVSDALKEIGILRRLKESRAVNVNMFVEAFHFHSQLWIVSEYCSGGSLSTLRRATENKLPERLIITIARELALGLKSVHSAGIVHRDIKAANVMIDEKGHLQIIDFGVSGIVLSNLDEHKRKTIIGTPHWMPPEMHQNQVEVAHGMEVDVWSYGITIFECAMGAPPHARTAYSRELRSKIRQTKAPRLPEDRFSTDLADLVEFALESNPRSDQRWSKFVSVLC